MIKNTLIITAAFGVLFGLSSCERSHDSANSSNDAPLSSVVASGREASQITLTLDPTPQVTYSDPAWSLAYYQASGSGVLLFDNKNVTDLSFNGSVYDVAVASPTNNQSTWVFRMNKISGGGEYLTLERGKRNTFRIFGQVSVHGDRTIEGIPQTEGVWGDLVLDTEAGTGTLTVSLPIHPYRQFQTTYVFSLTLS